MVLLLDPVSHVSTLDVKLFLERLDWEYRERKTRFDLRLEVFLEVLSLDVVQVEARAEVAVLTRIFI